MCKIYLIKQLSYILILWYYIITKQYVNIVFWITEEMAQNEYGLSMYFMSKLFICGVDLKKMIKIMNKWYSLQY